MAPSYGTMEGRFNVDSLAAPPTLWKHMAKLTVDQIAQKITDSEISGDVAINGLVDNGFTITQAEIAVITSICYVATVARRKRFEQWAGQEQDSSPIIH